MLTTSPLKIWFAFCGVAALMAGCGQQLDTPTAGVDENEANGVEIASTLKVPSDAVVFNTGGAGLNLRGSPSTSAHVLVTMPEGAQVHVSGGPQNGFYQVQYSGKGGWAHGNYLRPVDAGGHGGGNYPGNIHWDAAYSGNYTPGRNGVKITKIIIHDMEGTYESAISWFKDPASQVSAHYCIRSSDGDITQMVREQDIAWHAGNWPYNEAAIGIEHEGWMADPGRWYSETMYRRSAQLTAAIAKRYGIPIDRTHIIGHNQVPPPSTHVDPGNGWNWGHYLDLVRSFE